MANINWKGVLGIVTSFFRIGTLGWKDDSGVMAARDSGDTTLKKVKLADGTADDHAVSKLQMENAIAAVSTTGVLKTIRVAVTTTATQTFSEIPANARIKDKSFEVTTPFSAGATVQAGWTEDPNGIFDDTDYGTSVPQTAGKYGDPDSDDAWHTSARNLVISVGGTPVAGAGIFKCTYYMPIAS